MSADDDNMIGTISPGFLAPADGSYAPNGAQGESLGTGVAPGFSPASVEEARSPRKARCRPKGLRYTGRRDRRLRPEQRAPGRRQAGTSELAARTGSAISPGGHRRPAQRNSTHPPGANPQGFSKLVVDSRADRVSGRNISRQDPRAPPSNPTPKSVQAADAILPAADLKPLYDFALDCQACQAKLAAAQSDLTDKKTKSAASSKDQDAAVRAAKGGSVLRRISRAPKWFAKGAAARSVAAKATH